MTRKPEEITKILQDMSLLILFGHKGIGKAYPEEMSLHAEAAEILYEYVDQCHKLVIKEGKTP